MTRKLITILMLIATFGSAAECTMIKKTLVSKSADKLRLVLVLDAPARYRVNKGNAFTQVIIPGVSIGPAAQQSFPNSVMDNLTLEDHGGTSEVMANFRYLTSCRVFALANPPRIVMDFSKLSKMLIPKLNVTEIQKVDVRSTPEKFKIIISLTSTVPYKLTTTEVGMILELPDTNSIIKSRKIETKDKMISRVGIDQVGKSTLVSIAQNYPSFYQIYKLDDPTRLVIEFDKASKSTVAAKDIIPGLRYVKLVKGTEEGPVTINALIVDQNVLKVYPYVPHKKDDPPSLIGAMGSLFTFWIPKEETKYYKDRVRNMVKDSGAVAGINGTFFGERGEPLGVLMMNGELVSYSINDRTALIIDKSNRSYIDNVSLYGEASIEGSIVQLTGINMRRMKGGAIVYTPRYGQQTDEDSPGIILSVENGLVKNVSRARGWIPADGFALSLDPSYYESLGDRIKVGSRLDLSLKLIPLSGVPDLDILHVIGGGPRLLKAGQIYISRNSEKFRSDIAKSRAARSGVGISKDGSLVFVTIDKCHQSQNSSKSAGATLDEFAQVMKDLDCVDAMNLDGGGSSTLVLNADVVNTPANGQEIAVSNGILIGK